VQSTTSVNQSNKQTNVSETHLNQHQPTTIAAASAAVAAAS